MYPGSKELTACCYHAAPHPTKKWTGMNMVKLLKILSERKRIVDYSLFFFIQYSLHSRHETFILKKPTENNLICLNVAGFFSYMD